MEISKRERVKLVEQFLSMLDLTKKRARKYKQLTSGSTLLSKGIKEFAGKKINKGQQYLANMTVFEVPNHRELINDIITKATDQENLEDLLAKHLVQWGKPGIINKKK